MVRLGDVIIIGPGSEWLWAMAQFLALAATGLAILRQLAAQRSANLFEWYTELDLQWSSEAMVRARLALMRELHHRSPELGAPYAGDEMLYYFDRMGFMTARGHIRAEDLWDGGYAGIVEWYWAILEPYLTNDREHGVWHFPWFARLERAMREQDAKHKLVRPEFDRSRVDAEIADMIQNLTRKLDMQGAAAPTRRPAGGSRQQASRS